MEPTDRIEVIIDHFYTFANTDITPGDILNALKGALATVFCERTREQMNVQKLTDQL